MCIAKSAFNQSPIQLFQLFLSVHFAIQHILAENYGNDLICKQQWDMPRSHSESSTDDWLHNCKVEAEVEHDEGGDL